MIKSVAAIGIVAVVCLSTMSITYGEGGRIKVYLQSKCSSDVKIKIEYPGGTMEYPVDRNSNKPDTFTEGTKIFDSKGREAHVVTTSSEGKTIVVCE